MPKFAEFARFQEEISLSGGAQGTDPEFPASLYVYEYIAYAPTEARLQCHYGIMRTRYIWLEAKLCFLCNEILAFELRANSPF